jgi:chaperonin cofactor prefoldin
MPVTNGNNSNNKGIILFLVLALVGSWAYFLYNKKEHQDTVTLMETKIQFVDSSRGAIQEAYDLVSAKADSLTLNNSQLQGALAERGNEIQQLKSKISAIIKNKQASDADLSLARQMILELNGKVEGLFAEIEKLKGENKQLTVANEQLNTEKSQLTNDKQNLEQNLTATKKELDEKVDIASTLHASNIGIAALNVKNNGAAKATTSAKRADLIRISFTLDPNKISASGTKDIYVCITGPDGKSISEGASFNTRDEGNRSYTSKVSVNYEQGKASQVSFDWKQAATFEMGNYKIEIYNNGFKIGEGITSLKKGGLF